MTITVGRVGLDVTLNNPSTLTLNGDVLSLSGAIKVANVGIMAVVRRQLAGYVDNPWEKVVPVTFSLDDSIDGFYRVIDATVDVPTFGYRNGFATYDLTLERVRGYASPVAESSLYGAARTGKPGGVTASTWHAIPTSAGGYSKAASVTGSTRTGPGGTVTHYRAATEYYDSIPTFMLPPSDWYDMAATIASGAYTVTGTQFPAGSTGWSLSNGLIRIYCILTGTIDWYIDGPIFATPASYGSPYTIKPGYYVSGTALTSFGLTGTKVTVLRNSPEECCLRLTYQSPGLITVDISLRRGSFFADVTIKSNDSRKYGLGLGGSGLGGLTALTSGGGYRSTNTDANSNRIISCSGQTSSVVGDDAFYLTSAGTFNDMMVGLEVGAGSAAAPDAGTDLRDQFFAAITETQNVVSR